MPSFTSSNLICNKAYSDTLATACLKAQPEDFCVEEILGFEPEGEGEHVYIWVEKKGLNTSQVIADLSKQLDIARKNIGYSGLKDKQAFTGQWLSFVWPIKQELPEINGQSWQVLKTKRHLRKLKRGVHKGNQFTLHLTNVGGEKDALDARLQTIAKQGFPNYFGLQRFGFDGSNISKAERLFLGEIKLKPAQKSMLYSAARSYLFNQYLSNRIEQGLWDKTIAGDVYMLDGSHSVFNQSPDETIITRLEQGDIHCSGVLHGKGDAFGEQAQQLWQNVLDDNTLLAEGLVKANCSTHYRALRAVPKDLQWQWLKDDVDNQSLELKFFLPAGVYATALLHELVNIEEAVW